MPGIDEAREFGRAISDEFPAITFNNIQLQGNAETVPTNLKDQKLSVFALPISSVDGLSPDSLLLNLSGAQNYVSEIVLTGFSQGIAAGTAVVIVAVTAILVGGSIASYQIYNTDGKTIIKAGVKADVKSGQVDAHIELSSGK